MFGGGPRFAGGGFAPKPPKELAEKDQRRRHLKEGGPNLGARKNLPRLQLGLTRAVVLVTLGTTFLIHSLLGCGSSNGGNSSGGSLGGVGTDTGGDTSSGAGAGTGAEVGAATGANVGGVGGVGAAPSSTSGKGGVGGFTTSGRSGGTGGSVRSSGAGGKGTAVIGGAGGKVSTDGTGGTANCVDNVAADPSLAPLVASSNIATTPGKLKLLPIGTAGEVQTRGYAEYVPPSYADHCGWPVIINLHGDGELGDGKTLAALAPFANSCLPGQISQGQWDAKQRFVVLSPQFASYDDRTGANVQSFIQFAKANYKIDPKRIYLTAVSGGGVALGSYLVTYSGGEAAAALPVFCYVPPIAQAGKWKHVPVWLFDGSADTTVNPDNVLKVYTTLVAANPAVPPRVTLFTGVGHDVTWVNKVYAPSTMVENFEVTWSNNPLVPYSNIYDWMLQYHR